MGTILGTFPWQEIFNKNELQNLLEVHQQDKTKHFKHNRHIVSEKWYNFDQLGGMIQGIRNPPIIKREQKIELTYSNLTEFVSNDQQTSVDERRMEKQKDRECI